MSWRIRYLMLQAVTSELSGDAAADLLDKVGFLDDDDFRSAVFAELTREGHDAEEVMRNYGLI
ncbi:MAG TPA: hypothetical protein VLF21_02270 [Candidatus Saccharimonadales bacterium]|nr:hypothetical protein [Candidatus Saccharimonadales bacterium]